MSTLSDRVRDWAQLVRVPNTLTASADVFAGFAIVAGFWFEAKDSLVVVSIGAIASISFYWAGMILNDVFDVEEDRVRRRRGPLVDSRIAVSTARLAGRFLLASGICLSLVAVALFPTGGSAFSYAIVATTAFLLVGSILLYDSRWKSTKFGPWLMGLCRALNMLLGASLGIALMQELRGEWPPSPILVSLAMAVVGHALFVLGITLAARREEFSDQSRSKLTIAWGMSLLGILLIAGCSLWQPNELLRLDRWTFFPLLVLLLAGPWMRRAVASIREPSVGRLVPAIKQAIITILFLDAALTLQFAGDMLGTIVCLLAVPTFLMARIFRMT